VQSWECGKWSNKKLTLSEGVVGGTKATIEIAVTRNWADESVFCSHSYLSENKLMSTGNHCNHQIRVDDAYYQSHSQVLQALDPRDLSKRPKLEEPLRSLELHFQVSWE
jgi:hypothetical protein